MDHHVSKEGKRYAPNSVQQVDRFGGCSVMESIMVVGPLFYMWQVYWWSSYIETLFCNITKFRTWTSTVEWFSISLACSFAGLKPNRLLVSVCPGGIYHPRHVRNFLRHCSLSGRTFHRGLYTVWLLPCVVVVEVPSVLMLVITDTVILPTHVSHNMPVYVSSGFPRYTISDMYRVISFSWRLGASIVSTSFVIELWTKEVKLTEGGGKHAKKHQIF